MIDESERIRQEQYQRWRESLILLGMDPGPEQEPARAPGAGTGTRAGGANAHVPPPHFVSPESPEPLA